jgi:hypothetical protein
MVGFTPGERALGTNCIGGWVDPRAGLDDLEERKFLILSGLELRSLSRSARTQSLYWLLYPGEDNIKMDRFEREVAHIMIECQVLHKIEFFYHQNNVNLASKILCNGVTHFVV